MLESGKTVVEEIITWECRPENPALSHVREADTTVLPWRAPSLERTDEELWMDCWTSFIKGAIMESKNDEKTKRGEEKGEERAPDQAKEVNGSFAKQLLLDIREISRENKSLQKEVASLKETILRRDDLMLKYKELEKTNTDLKPEIENLRGSVKESRTTIETLTAERNAAEKKLKAMQEAMDELRKEMRKQTKDTEPVPRQTGRAKASFHIDIYRRDDETQYDGWINLVGSDKDCKLTGFDKDAIIRFLADNLPKSEKAIQTERIAEDSERPFPVDKRLPVAEKTGHVQLSVRQSGTDTPTQMIQHDKPFDISIAIDPQALRLGKSAPKSCTASVEAKPLEGGATRTVGRYTGSLSPKGTFTVRGHARTLSPGFYYLATRVAVKPEKAGEQPVNFSEERFPVDVY